MERKKIGLLSILTKEEDNDVVEYMMKMVRIDLHPLSIVDVKMKVVEIYQQRSTPFKDGIPAKSWLKWFKIKHF